MYLRTDQAASVYAGAAGDHPRPAPPRIRHSPRLRATTQTTRSRVTGPYAPLFRQPRGLQWPRPDRLTDH